MKLLENAKLDSISSSLCMNTGDCSITGRYGLNLLMDLFTVSYSKFIIHKHHLYIL